MGLLLSSGACPLLLSVSGYTALDLAMYENAGESAAIQVMLDGAEACWTLSLTLNPVARGHAARRRVHAQWVEELQGLGALVGPTMPDEVWRLVGEMAYSRGHPGSSVPGRAVPEQSFDV